MEVANDMKIFFSAPIIEAYGMTEMSGALTVTDFKDNENGMAGGVIRTLQLKLLDRKEMNYHSKTELDGQLAPTGEICCRGLNVFKGYFLDEEKTNDAFDKDGWLKSGDVGRIMPNNKGLKIIDRVKELFKLSQGEYIAPSKLENVYVKNKYIIQICIYGNSYESYLIAIICPNRVEVKKFLIESGKLKENEDNVEDFYNDKDLHAEIKKTFDALAKTNNFNSLEKPLKYLLGKTEFSIQNEMMTPTMKLCRNKIESFYKDEINKLYAQK
jgi:long-chain acyl-CoA synthetase